MFIFFLLIPSLVLIFLLLVLTSADHGSRRNWTSAIIFSTHRGRQLHSRACDRREQHGGPAAGSAGPGDDGGHEERVHGAGTCGQRGRLYEHSPGGGAVPGRPRSAHSAAGPVYHRQERPLRPHPWPHGHNEDHPEPAGPDPQGPKLCQSGRRKEGVHQENQVTSFLCLSKEKWAVLAAAWDENDTVRKHRRLCLLFLTWLDITGDKWQSKPRVTGEFMVSLTLVQMLFFS